MKVPKEVIFLVLSVALQILHVQAVKFNPREISRLVATVDPKTCNCVTQEYCKIDIPYTSFLGVQCHAGTKFCCLARQQIKPFVTAKDFSEIVAAAKRLNIDLNGKGKSFVSNPKHVETAVEKIKEVEKELVNVEDTKEKSKIQEIEKTEIVRNDRCHCIERSQCPEEKMDFTFGKSCQLGTVRCCNHEHEKQEIAQESLPKIPYTFTSTAATPKEINLPSNTKEILEPLPLEPLTFTSTAATPKKVHLNNPIPQNLNNPVPQMVTKMPLSQLKNQKTGLPKTFFVYSIPNAQDLAGRVVNKPTIAYQPRPITDQIVAIVESDRRSDQDATQRSQDATQNVPIQNEEDTNAHSPLVPAVKQQEIIPQVHVNQAPVRPKLQAKHPIPTAVGPPQHYPVYPSQQIYPDQGYIQQKNNHLLQQQHQQREAWRRANNPTIVEKVTDLLTPSYWFGK